MLATELERPRVVSEQVIQHLTEVHGAGRDTLGEFFLNDLPKLEDYEIDLALSPLFTPTLKDQSVFAAALGPTVVPRTEWPELVSQLAARPTLARLLIGGDQVHRVALREVTIERFVHRLRLDGTIPEAVFALVENFEPAEDRAWLKAIARRAIWEKESRRQILVQYLSAASGKGGHRLSDATELLKLMETYEPEDHTGLSALIPFWQRVLQQEINSGAGAKPFFNERVEELHGGGRDQRRHDNARQAAKVGELEFLQRLQTVLGGEPK